ncbi:aldehyde dehydrogenase family protein, partial [Enterobacter hormaechei]|nr:aldehyde dehydrogenase family protein [Enterobacter hormaechei]
MTNNVNTELLRQQAYINGQWVDADNQATFKVTNPANGEVIAHVSNMGAAETERAIAAAQQALPAWRTMTAKQRSQILQRWFQLMMANQPALAELLSRE